MRATRIGSIPKPFSQGCSILSFPAWTDPRDSPDSGAAPALALVKPHKIPVVLHPLPDLNLLCVNARIPSDCARDQVPNSHIPAWTSNPCKHLWLAGTVSRESLWRAILKAPNTSSSGGLLEWVKKKSTTLAQNGMFHFYMEYLYFSFRSHCQNDGGNLISQSNHWCINEWDH